ncbi:putative apoptosis-inducing factor 1, mitochondrial [Condylostylus longicornis]|uniref:putative apoptosis-inducing factor 1, mitochondrial n=1 Tax=Condylostylus longicornis TaxID=2530218 RepID=UPI00244E3A73|nr:putative apoptosis-inducing factor 1, mitochondrial [Condylostylus longicornis]
MLRIFPNNTSKLNGCRYQMKYFLETITGRVQHSNIHPASFRLLSDSKEFSGKNAQTLQSKDNYVKANMNPPPSSCPPDDSKPDSSNKLLIALVLAGVGGGLLYLLTNNKKVPPEQSSASSIVPVGVKIPASSADIPKHIPYLLIGGGTASFSAFRAIKSHDPKAKVMVISNEFRKPYMRPPLSKELWYNAEIKKNPDEDFHFKQWNGATRSIYYEPEEFYVDPTKLMQSPNGGVAVCHGYSVKKVLPYEQKVILSDGTEIKYDKCLIATGCTPKNLDIISTASQKVKEKVSVFRNPEDFMCLKNIVDNSQSIVIIGSGFLGSELACALSKYGSSNNLTVYQIFNENGNMAKILPEYLSDWTTENVIKQGVNVIQSVQVTSIDRANDKLKLHLSNGKTVVTDHVVVCAGCEANTDIAKSSGLEVDNTYGGFLVNAELEARKNLFVAGDAACFYDPLLGRRRVEHHDHSVVSGRLAGENMTGLKNPYKHQSMFWSDLGPELGYEGIGLIDSSLPTVGVFAKMPANKLEEKNALENSSIQTSTSTTVTEEPSKSTNSDSTKNPENKVEKPESHLTPKDDYGRGVIFYLKDNKIVGILLWNIFNRIGLARQIINENKTYDDLNEVAKLFEIHS